MKIKHWERAPWDSPKNVRVVHDMFGAVTAQIIYGYSVGVALKPDEARAMAAALVECADAAEQDPKVEHADDV